MTILGRIGTTMRDTITGALQGTGRIGNVAIDTVRDTTANTIQSARSVGREVEHLAQNAIIGTLHATAMSAVQRPRGGGHRDAPGHRNTS